MADDQEIKYIVRNYRILVEIDSRYVNIHDNRVASIMNAMGYSSYIGRVDARGLGSIFLRGLDMIESEIEHESGRSWKWIEHGKEISEILAKREEMQRAYDAYARLTLDEFVEYCKRRDLDFEEIIERYAKEREGMAFTKSEKYRLFLELLLKDKGQIAIDEVKQLAFDKGLCENETDWKLMRVTASRGGYSGHATYGTWKLPEK